MKDLFSFIQQAAYGTIICPVCDKRFIDNNFGMSEHAVSVPLPNHHRTSHETCGKCGDWSGETIEDIKAGNIFEL